MCAPSCASCTPNSTAAADLDERADARAKWLEAIDGYRKEWDKLVAPGFTR